MSIAIIDDNLYANQITDIFKSFSHHNHFMANMFEVQQIMRQKGLLSHDQVVGVDC